MELAIWPHHRDGAFGIDGEFPPTFVYQVMMSPTDRHQIVEVGWSSPFEGEHVVDVAPVDADVASGE